MKKLANISAFESLASSAVSSISVFNGLSWDHPVDNAIMRVDWGEFERLARGQSSEIDALLDEVKELGLTRDFIYTVQRKDEYDHSDDSWWEQFKSADKSSYWSWLKRERKKQYAEDGEPEPEYDPTAEEAYRESKRLSLMETGRWDSGYDVGP